MEVSGHQCKLSCILGGGGRLFENRPHLGGCRTYKTPSRLNHAPAWRSVSDTVPPGMEGALDVLRLQPAGGGSAVGAVYSPGRIESVEEEYDGDNNTKFKPATFI